MGGRGAQSGFPKDRTIGVLKSNRRERGQYSVYDPVSGEAYEIVDNKLQDVEVFAGRGAGTPYRDAYKRVSEFGGNEKDWQHVKGKATIRTPDGDFLAEVHWSQCQGVGKVLFRVKRWLE